MAPKLLQTTVYQILVIRHDDDNRLDILPDLYETKKLAEEKGRVYSLGNATVAYKEIKLWKEEPQKVEEPEKLDPYTYINALLLDEGLGGMEIIALADVFHNGLWGTADFDFCDVITGAIGAIIENAENPNSSDILETAFKRIGNKSQVIGFIEDYWGECKNSNSLIFLNENFMNWEEVQEWAKEVLKRVPKC